MIHRRLRALRLRFSHTLALIAACVAAPIGAVAESWPQFRGPQSNGKSSETNLPIEWSASKNVAWHVPLPGPGSSSPIIHAGRIFITCYSGYGVDRNDPGDLENLKRHLLALDAKTGKEIWRQTVDARLPEDDYRGYITEHGYASNTPVTDGQHIFVFHGKSGLHAYNWEGTPVWQADLGQESSNRRWGSAASPILHGNHVIVNASEESQSIRALDKHTGNEVWKAEAGSLELAYGTPRIVNDPANNPLLIISVPQELWALNPATGMLQWFCETGLPGNICPSVTDANGVLVTFGGFPTTGTVAIKVPASGDGDVTDSAVLWQSRSETSYVPSAVAHEGRLYWVDDQGQATCVDARSGDPIYQERLSGLDSGGRSRAFYASVVYADGHLYAVSRRNGVFVIKAGPEFQQVAHNRVSRDDDTDFNASPAISEGHLYLRSNRALYAIGN